MTLDPATSDLPEPRPGLAEFGYRQIVERNSDMNLEGNSGSFICQKSFGSMISNEKYF
jgi:hypothetical protein